MSEKVTFQELIDTIAEQSNSSKQFTHDFVKDFVSIINNNLEKGETVHIAGFGKFKLRSMDEREGINPQTGEAITIPAHNKVVFKPYKDLRELVNAPYLHMEPEIIEEEEEKEESDTSSETDSDEAEQQFIPTAPPPTVQPESDEPIPPSPEDSKSEEQFPDTFEQAEDETEKPLDEDPFGLGRGTESSANFAYDSPSEFDEDDDDDIVEFTSEIEAEEPVNPPELDKEKEEDQTPTDEIDGKEKQEVQSDDLDSEDEPFADISDTKEEEAHSLNQSFEESGEETEPEEESPTSRPTPTPLFKNRRHKRKRGGGNFLVIIAAVIVLFLLAGSWYYINWAEQQSDGVPAADTTTEQTADTQQQDAASTSSQATGAVADDDVETVSHTVESGETLWGLADDNYENPYLWPWIYNTNQASIINPNIIRTGQELSIPQKEESSGGLTTNDSLQVAIGYVETYRWYKGNNPDEAKYYLYVARQYHSEVLQHTDIEIDEEDLAFANQAE